MSDRYFKDLDVKERQKNWDPFVEPNLNREFSKKTTYFFLLLHCC